MRQVSIDFVPRVRPAPWMWKAVAALGVVAIGLLFAALEMKAEFGRARAELGRLRAEGPAASAEVPSPTNAALYEASARQLLVEKTSAWPEALKALEVTEVTGIQIVGVELSTPEQRIRVEVQFTDLSQLLKYLGELNLGEPTRRWTLEQTTAPNAPGSPSTAFLLGSLSR